MHSPPLSREEWNLTSLIPPSPILPLSPQPHRKGCDDPGEASRDSVTHLYARGADLILKKSAGPLWC
eukprot:923855-Rhodomonas_salina.2